jgi:hypothetical protein
VPVYAVCFRENQRAVLQVDPAFGYSPNGASRAAGTPGGWVAAKVPQNPLLSAEHTRDLCFVTGD